MTGLFYRTELGRQIAELAHSIDRAAMRAIELRDQAATVSVAAECCRAIADCHLAKVQLLQIAMNADPEIAKARLAGFKCPNCGWTVPQFSAVPDIDRQRQP